VRLGPSTPGDYVRARVLVPRNPGVTEIYTTHVHTFIISLLFTVHNKIIMLIGTWRTTRENSATTRVVWDALG
jgi:predicted ferric reductase